jgi:hypothetical protein
MYVSDLWRETDYTFIFLENVKMMTSYVVRYAEVIRNTTNKNYVPHYINPKFSYEEYAPGNLKFAYLSDLNFSTITLLVSRNSFFST